MKTFQLISANVSKKVCIQYSSGNFHIIIIIIIIINWFPSKSSACQIQKQLLLTPEAFLDIFLIKWFTGWLNSRDRTNIPLRKKFKIIVPKIPVRRSGRKQSL